MIIFQINLTFVENDGTKPTQTAPPIVNKNTGAYNETITINFSQVNGSS